VIRFKIGLYFFSSRRSGVFFRFFFVTYLDVPGRPLALCSVHSRITCCLPPFLAIVQYVLKSFNVAFCFCHFQGDMQAVFINCSQPGGWYVQFDPTVFFRKIKPFGENVHHEFSFGSPFWVRNVVPNHHFFTCNLTNSRHFAYFLNFCPTFLNSVQSNYFLF